MAMQINTNILSMTAQRNVAANESRLGTAIERLSTGLRINSAGDDAAGLAISERFTSQIRGQTVAQRNANDAISLSQTAEGALSVMSEVLQRMRELTIQSLNEMNTPGDRAAIQREIAQLREEIERIAQDTTFNGKEILNGTLGALNFQIGSERGDVLAITGLDARASSLTGTQKAVSSSANLEAVDYSSLGTLTINSETDVDLSGATSRDDVISAINAAFDGSVQAKAASETVVNLGAFALTASQTIDIGGETVTFEAADTTAQLAVDRINNTLASTDISAALVGGEVVLTSASGADIAVTESVETLFGGVTSNSGLTFEAGIEISSNLDNLTVGGAAATDLGLATANVVDQTLKLSEVSVATVFEANNALVTIDSAIDQVTGLRAQLGALQNRFENVVEVISVHRENLEAARSRIRDADFAAETANLTRAQILQQAGISSLAQANSAPQSVLSLLQ
jgi:flagellin